MMKGKLPILCAIVCLAVFVVTVGQLVAEQVVRTKDRTVYTQLAQVRHQPSMATPVAEATDDEVAGVDVSLQQLMAENEDMIGWITVPDTALDCPVMHTPESPEYYLRRNFYGEYSVSGTPFLDGSCTLEGTHWIVYGHRMNDGTMFASLLDFLEEDYRHSHSVIYFDTPTQRYEYQVVCGFYQDESGALWTEGYFAYETPEEFEEFQRYCGENAVFGGDETLDFEDNLMSLVTCSKDNRDMRFVLVTRRIS